MDYTIRAATPDEIPAFHDTIGIGFGFDSSPEWHENFAKTVELDRSRCAFDGTTMVGSTSAYSLKMTVPGAVVDAAGTTQVTVRPTHRRRGILRAMMAAHLEDIRERGEPLAALWASEAGIYGRFGYGPAAHLCTFAIDSEQGAFGQALAATGQFRLLSAEEALKTLPLVYDRVFSERPGHFARSAAWWEHRMFDPRWLRQGMTQFRYVLYEEAGEPRGYLQYRIRNVMNDTGLPSSELAVIELQALDATASAALWRHALDVDLVKTVRAWNQPVDDPLPWLLVDCRRLQQSQRDALWVRVIDLVQALEARRYGADGRVVMRMRDAWCPWNDGTFELAVEGERGRCRVSSADPEIEIDAESLGAIYLGGNRPTTLARAGRIVGSPDALRRADRLFAWEPAPWCPEVF